jgi:hypothetical protein
MLQSDCHLLLNPFDLDLPAAVEGAPTHAPCNGFSKHSIAFCINHFHLG